METSKNDTKALRELVEKQEALLRFDHFSYKDAWKLGVLMVNEAREKKLPIYSAMCWREPMLTMNSGSTVSITPSLSARKAACTCLPWRSWRGRHWKKTGCWIPWSMPFAAEDSRCI